MLSTHHLYLHAVCEYGASHAPSVKLSPVRVELLCSKVETTALDCAAVCLGIDMLIATILVFIQKEL